MKSIFLGEQFNLVCRRTSNTTSREVFHAHSQLEITYIHEGYGQLITEGQVSSLEPGMLMIFRPFQLHHIQIQVSRQQPFIRNVLMVELDLLKAHWPQFIVTYDFIQDLLEEQSPIQPIRLAATSPLVQRMEQYADTYPDLLPHEVEEDTRLFYWICSHNFATCGKTGSNAAPKMYSRPVRFFTLMPKPSCNGLNSITMSLFVWRISQIHFICPPIICLMFSKKRPEPQSLLMLKPPAFVMPVCCSPVPRSPFPKSVTVLV